MQRLQLSNGDTVSLMRERRTRFVAGDQMRSHTAEALECCAAWSRRGSGIGLQIIAAKDSITIVVLGKRLESIKRETW